mgnify:CR=1 FL=1
MADEMDKFDGLDDIFAVANQSLLVNVLGTLERVDELLAAAGNDAADLPFMLDGEANIVQKTGRYYVFLPPKYVPLVIGRDLTPREFWNKIGRAHV